ncbi:MAG: hypothetical protein ACTHKY_09025, partial [Ginsengibacter sp.]
NYKPGSPEASDALIAKSVCNNKTKNNSLSYHIYFDCPNDLNGRYISLSSVQKILILSYAKAITI